MSAELAIQELRKDVRVLTDLVSAMADMIGPRVTRAQILRGGLARMTTLFRPGLL